MHVPFNPWKEQNKFNTLARLDVCIEEIRRRMTQNFLKLNDSKIEFQIIESVFDLKSPTKTKEWEIAMSVHATVLETLVHI